MDLKKQKKNKKDNFSLNGKQTLLELLALPISANLLSLPVIRNRRTLARISSIKETLSPWLH